MIKNRNITYWIVILPILAIVLTSITLTYKFVSYEIQDFKKESQKLEKIYITDLQKLIKNRIDRLINLIEDNIKISQEEEQLQIKELVNIGYSNIENIYIKNQHLPKDQIIKKITESLENLRFFNEKSGYFFLVDFESNVLMHPQSKKNINKIDKALKKTNGNYVVKKLTNIAKTKGESFTSWTWVKHKTGEKIEKVGYLKAFRPLQIYVGAGRYKKDIEEKIKNRVKMVLNILKYGQNEYVFAMDTKGTTVTHINKDLIGKTINDVNNQEQNIINAILKKAEKEDGDFLQYTTTSYNLEKISKKISFVKKIPSLDWIIGTGRYTSILYDKIEKQRMTLKDELNEASQTIIFISIVISILLISIMFYIAQKIQEKFYFYELQVSKKNRSLRKLNENLESRVEEQVLKIREKDELLHQQSKLASMGEMIGNIAHQWRQPLSAISTAASGIKLQSEMNILNSKTMNEALDAIVNNTQTLSQTIEDFRNFFKTDKIKTTFRISDPLNKVMSLINATLNDKQINVIKNIQDFEITNLENELTQALLNIMNNAKDALIENEIDEKMIFITTYEKRNQLHIVIKDNAGGIDEEVLPKIFEPYFTTKFTSQGTGIGLYMTQIIIVNHMHGKIFVRNETFNYNKKEYTGAVFEIVLKK